jgi:hypothetical protein
VRPRLILGKGIQPDVAPAAVTFSTEALNRGPPVSRRRVFFAKQNLLLVMCLPASFEREELAAARQRYGIVKGARFQPRPSARANQIL